MPDPDRADRLAQALRDNLRRRKAQARDQTPSSPEAGQAPASPGSEQE